MKAWIENDRIRDICHGDPNECYHPDVAQHYNVDVPEDAQNGDGWIDNQLVKPEPPPPAPPAPRMISADDVRKCLTLSERVKWDANKLDEVVTVKLEFAAPRSVEDSTELLTFLVEAGILSQASVDKVLI